MPIPNGEFTSRECADELKREVALRLAVYPRLVRNGSLRPEDAQRQTAIMQQCAAFLERAAQFNDPQADLFKPQPMPGK